MARYWGIDPPCSDMLSPCGGANSYKWSSSRRHAWLYHAVAIDRTSPKELEVSCSIFQHPCCSRCYCWLFQTLPSMEQLTLRMQHSVHRPKTASVLKLCNWRRLEMKREVISIDWSRSIWGVSINEGTSTSSIFILRGFSHINHLAIGVPPWPWKPQDWFLWARVASPWMKTTDQPQVPTDRPNAPCLSPFNVDIPIFIG